MCYTIYREKERTSNKLKGEITMKKTITEMQNDIIAKFGFEHECTIHFFKITENKFAKKLISHYYNKYMDMNIDEDDE